jgi:hypothetical protein
MPLDVRSVVTSVRWCMHCISTVQFTLLEEFLFCFCKGEQIESEINVGFALEWRHDHESTSLSQRTPSRLIFEAARLKKTHRHV